MCSPPARPHGLLNPKWPTGSGNENPEQCLPDFTIFTLKWQKTTLDCHCYLSSFLTGMIIFSEILLNIIVISSLRLVCYQNWLPCLKTWNPCRRSCEPMHVSKIKSEWGIAQLSLPLFVLFICCSICPPCRTYLPQWPPRRYNIPTFDQSELLILSRSVGRKFPCMEVVHTT